MGNSFVSVHLIFLSVFVFFILAAQVPSTAGQLSPAESRVLFRVQQLLEYPQALQGWNNWTSFCYLPPSPSLRIVCSVTNHVTELTIVGNRTSALSGSFSVDSLFTVLTKLSNLRVLSLVSLGIWGPFPAKISRLSSLQVLNISSNFVSGTIPGSVSGIKNLTSLALYGNLLNGSVPDLRGLSVLQELDLSSNDLGPQFPWLPNHLVSISLSNNSFRSRIPLMGFNKFSNLEHLDLSSNKLLGPIPLILYTLPSIQYLDLRGNQLSGAIPTNTTCIKTLQFVDISSNFLIGKLPLCNAASNPKRTVLSSWNCLSDGSSKVQHPAAFCQKGALAVNPSPSKRKQEGEVTRIRWGLLLGIIGAAVVFVMVVGLFIFIICSRRKETKTGDTSFRFYGSAAVEKTSTRTSPIVDSRHVPQRMRRMATFGLPPYQIFTLEEMEDATNNFDPANLVLEGIQGQVYKGSIRDGSEVMVKCLKIKQKHSPQSLQQYVDALSKLRDRHLVSVLGHCIVTYQDHPNTASTVFIVLEHAMNGSLKDYFSARRKKELLKWPQRMGIVIGIARGIEFLHTGNAPGIFGNDLKMENILLDDSLNAKISGYNVSVPEKVGSPINAKNGSKSTNSAAGCGEKDDIYQLGVILLQVITGKLIGQESEVDELKLQVERSFAESASKLRATVDSSMRGSYAYESLRTAVEITINCLSEEPSQRPSVQDVLWNLQYSLQVQAGWNSSGNLSLK